MNARTAEMHTRRLTGMGAVATLALAVLAIATEKNKAVIGSGAGGFVAALAAAANHANVLILEKSDLWGGSSATSGGGIWIPNSHLAQAAGITDSADLAFQYVRALSAENVPDGVKAPTCNS